MNGLGKISVAVVIGSSLWCSVSLPAAAEEGSRYMGADVTLGTAPNGAVVNAEVLDIFSKILYSEPIVEKVADGVWCIGGYSIGNTTVIEGDDGLIVYDTGDNKEEGEHLRKAIETISDKPVKAIIYSHSHKLGEWNLCEADTALKDHTMTEIARANNDTLYISCLLDLRKDPVILEMPAFDSKYVSLMITGYDHYVNIPMATRLGNFG